MRLLKTYLDANVQRMMDNNVRMKYIGAPTNCPPRSRRRCNGRETTARNTGTTLTLALKYGGRSELVDAFRSLAAEMKQKHLNPPTSAKKIFTAIYIPRTCPTPTC